MIQQVKGIILEASEHDTVDTLVYICNADTYPENPEWTYTSGIFIQRIQSYGPITTIIPYGECSGIRIYDEVVLTIDWGNKSPNGILVTIAVKRDGKTLYYRRYRDN